MSGRSRQLFASAELCATILRMQNALRALLLVIVVAPALQATAQTPDPVATWLDRVNEARLAEALPPFGYSSLLAAAAQRHADDLAANGLNTEDAHLGSDGSTSSERIAEAGYAAWTWNGGQSITGENVWSGGIDQGMAFFLDDAAHRKNLLSITHREIGIGASTDATGRGYYVLDLGARPNVLPIFINDGAINTDNEQIAVRLTNEEARPGGEGAIFMGQAIEIRLSGQPAFEDQTWQPWQSLVQWTLPDAPGEQAVYVQLRDAAGRTAASTDTILVGTGTPPATATPLPPSPTPEPSATPLPPTLASEFTATPLPEETSISTATAVPEVTMTAEAPFRPQPPVATPDGAMQASPTTTPFPTWTPLAPTAAPQEVEPPDSPLTVVAGLQGLAFILGIVLIFHRGKGSGKVTG